MEGKFQKLTPEQIARLEAAGCCAENWDEVLVAGGFDPANVRNCRFRGQVRIGASVVISNVRVHLKNVHVGEGVRIEDVSLIECEGETSFGIGTMVAAVNENGGRQVPLHLDMTAQTAYVMAMYRHRPRAIEHLMAIVEKQRLAALSTHCAIGRGAQIVGCGTIRNVNIGPGARIDGAQMLKNGTILSTPDAPAVVGYGVRAADFIFSRASRVESGTSLVRCFVGQGTLLEEVFVAADSLFFSNCIMAQGEACSVFAGPFTVSHHKATLLIAGLFSFFNAGSGANQSNHLFKGGPIHQGINERGCKYSSNAYVMLPARNGAFCTVLGSHSNHHDTSDFPYSFLMQNEGRSELIPAAALRSWGVVRDLAKWPARDKRPANPSDLIHFDEHNPYIASRIARALAVSAGLLANAGLETYSYERMKVKHSMLRRGKDLYRLAMDASLGAMLSVEPDPALIAEGEGEWVDLGGMYAPKRQVMAVIEGIESGRYTDMASVLAEFARIHASYPSFAYGWALAQLDQPDAQHVTAMIARGEEATRTLRKYAADDARKESDMLMATGYGIDSKNPQVKEADFEAVRGCKIN